MTNQAKDELSEFDEAPEADLTIEKTDDSDKGVKVAMEFPPGTDPSMIEAVMAQVAKQTAQMAKSK